MRDSATVGDGEFVEEFNHYWMGATFLSLLSDLTLPRLVKAVTIERSGGGTALIVADSKREVRSWAIRSVLGKPTKHEEALFLPLKAFGRPPYPSTDNEVYERLRKYDRKALKQWVRFLARRNGPAICIAALPTSNGPVVFGWRHHPRYEAPSLRQRQPRRKHRNWIVDVAALGLTEHATIGKLSGERIDRRRLARRSIGHVDDSGPNSFLLVGAGALGSNIAEAMVRSRPFQGCSIVDEQRLRFENIPRHDCTYADVGLHKAEALKGVLQRRDPALNVSTHCSNVLTCLEAVLKEASGIELVVLALGSQFVERHVTAILHRRLPAGTPIHSVWVTKDAATGYVFRTIAGTPGCISCFFETASADERSELTIDDTAIRREPGCASGFVNYGGDRLIRFSAVATQAILSPVESPFLMKWTAAPGAVLQTEPIEVRRPAFWPGCGCELPG